MDVLDYIYENLDPTLAYSAMKPAARPPAAGASCGSTERSAWPAACPAEGERLTLEPWNANVVRDLLCRFPPAE